MTNDNADSLIAGSEIVFINFYANWCRFSQMLEPIYDELADKAASEFPTTKVLVAKVDCDTETAFSQKNHINKYPTLKLYRYGAPVKKEYRGARTTDAFMNYLREQIADPVQYVKDFGELATLDPKKRSIVGYFSNKDSEDFKTYIKLANMLRDSCKFYAAIGENLNHKKYPTDTITFRDLGTSMSQEIPFLGPITHNDPWDLYPWTNDKCTPLVREITFENAEGLTEEGLPFLILFHKPDDMDSVKTFEREVQRQLAHEKNTINAVYADGYKFSHPLNHLGKSAADLPVLAIDSFRHMYLFPDYKKLTQGEHLKQFVADLHNGKLHREFHNGPDPTTEAPKIENIEAAIAGDGHIPKIPDGDNAKQNIPVISTPPESVFIKLAPSGDRYSRPISHDDGGEL